MRKWVEFLALAAVVWVVVWYIAVGVGK